MTPRRTCFVLVSALVLLAFSAAAAEEPPQLPVAPPTLACGPITVQTNAEGTLLVVTDQPRQAMAVYRVDGNVVKLIDVRRLDRDFAEERAKETSPTPSAPPSKDVPGTDPPSFIRPAKAVRLQADYRDDWAGGERWHAQYAVPATVEEAYSKIRGSFGDWKVANENADSNRVSVTLTLKSASETRQIEVGVEIYRRASGWAYVDVTEQRKR